MLNPFSNNFVCAILVFIFRYSYKYSTNVVSAADCIFINNTWENNYMLGIYKFTPTVDCNFDQFIKEFQIRQEY